MLSIRQQEYTSALGETQSQKELAVPQVAVEFRRLKERAVVKVSILPAAVAEEEEEVQVYLNVECESDEDVEHSVSRKRDVCGRGRGADGPQTALSPRFGLGARGNESLVTRRKYEKQGKPATEMKQSKRTHSVTEKKLYRKKQ